MRKVMLLVAMLTVALTGAAQSIKGYKPGTYHPKDIKVQTTFAGYRGYIETRHVKSGKVYGVYFRSIDKLSLDESKALIKLVNEKYGISLKLLDKSDEKGITTMANKSGYSYALYFRLDNRDDSNVFVFAIQDSALVHIFLNEKKQSKLNDM
jgi:hypothetical protein